MTEMGPTADQGLTLMRWLRINPRVYDRLDEQLALGEVYQYRLWAGNRAERDFVGVDVHPARCSIHGNDPGCACWRMVVEEINRRRDAANARRGYFPCRK